MERPYKSRTVLLGFAASAVALGALGFGLKALSEKVERDGFPSVTYQACMSWNSETEAQAGISEAYRRANDGYVSAEKFRADVESTTYFCTPEQLANSGN